MQRGCFPFLSFLHVPGKMSRPVWLMMGTAFRFTAPSSSAPAAAVVAHAVSQDTATAQRHKTTSTTSNTRSSMWFLTCKHTLVPWEFVKGESELHIPADYRKLRFVVGKLYVVDPVRQRAMRDCALDVRVVAMHPQLDVALLRAQRGGEVGQDATAWRVVSEAPTLELNTHFGEVTDTSGPPCCSIHGANASDDDVTATRTKCHRYDVTVDSNRDCDAVPCCDNTDTHVCPRRNELACLVGFRGSGRLGEVDTMDSSLLQKLSAEERAALLAQLSDVEGKQEPATLLVRILDRRGMCRGVEEDGRDVCYHGMSGSPLLLRTCAPRSAPLCVPAAVPRQQVVGELRAIRQDMRDDGAEPNVPMTCGGVLYGKHVDFPRNIGFTPVSAFLPWLRDTIVRLSLSQT